MRERLGLYLVIALVGAPLGYWWARPFDLGALAVAKPQPNDLLPIVYEFLRDLIPFLVLSVAARFFIVESTMRRIDPSYTTTPRRFVVQFGVVFVILAFSYISFYGSALPGALGAIATIALLTISVAAILLSQALFAALVDKRRSGGRGAPMSDAVKLSYNLTRTSFVPTLLVTVIGIFFVVFPVNLAIVPLFLAMLLKSPRWLALGTPLLILMFIYFECVRFALMARWYSHLARGLGPA
jgi:hypothetical protein